MGTQDNNTATQQHTTMGCGASSSVAVQARADIATAEKRMRSEPLCTECVDRALLPYTQHQNCPTCFSKGETTPPDSRRPSARSSRRKSERIDETARVAAVQATSSQDSSPSHQGKKLIRTASGSTSLLWEKREDPTSKGMYFYVNTQTGEQQREKPADFDYKSEQGQGLRKKKVTRSYGPSRRPSQREESPEEKQATQGGWKPGAGDGLGSLR